MMTKAEAKTKKALMPLIRHAAKNKGTITQVAKRLSQLCGQTIYRQNVEFWLHPDDAKRKQPVLGTGLYLMQVRDEICFGGIPD